MVNGESSYRRFLDGDDEGLFEIVRDYRDGMLLYVNGIVGNIFVAEEVLANFALYECDLNTGKPLRDIPGRSEDFWEEK